MHRHGEQSAGLDVAAAVQPQPRGLFVKDPVSAAARPPTQLQQPFLYVFKVPQRLPPPERLAACGQLAGQGATSASGADQARRAEGRHLCSRAAWTPLQPSKSHAGQRCVNTARTVEALGKLALLHRVVWRGRGG